MTEDRCQLYIGSQWVDARSSDVFDVVNPATEETIAYCADGGRMDMRSAISHAHEAFHEGPWPTMRREDRARIIRQIADGMVQRIDRLRSILIAEVGAEHSDHVTQLDRPIEDLYEFADLAESFGFETMAPPLVDPSAGVASYKLVHRAPAGVTGLIPTWDSPLMVTIQKIGPALAAGCTMVVKPSPLASLVNVELARIMEETDLPSGVVNLVTGGSEAAEELVTNPLIDRISFTGGVEVGRRIARSAAATLKRVHLELGGKSASIVLDDADVEAVAPQLTTYRRAGQSCGALTRCLVPTRLHDRLVAAMVDFLEGLKIGDPADPSVSVPPLISSERRESVEGYLEQGFSEGAVAATGGRRPDHLRRGFFVEPTVLIEATNDMTIAREEIFGPVVTVIRYDDLDAAVRMANDSDYGLSGAVVTKDTDRGLAVARRLRTGKVTIITGKKGAPRQPFGPFGGFKSSGIGREGGEWGVAEATELQTVTW